MVIGQDQDRIKPEKCCSWTRTILFFPPFSHLRCQISGYIYLWSRKQPKDHLVLSFSGMLECPVIWLLVLGWSFRVHLKLLSRFKKYASIQKKITVSFFSSLLFFCCTIKNKSCCTLGICSRFRIVLCLVTRRKW